MVLNVPGLPRATKKCRLIVTKAPEFLTSNHVYGN